MKFRFRVWLMWWQLVASQWIIFNSASLYEQCLFKKNGDWTYLLKLGSSWWILPKLTLFAVVVIYNQVILWWRVNFYVDRYCNSSFPCRKTMLFITQSSNPNSSRPSLLPIKSLHFFSFNHNNEKFIILSKMIFLNCIFDKILSHSLVKVHHEMPVFLSNKYRSITST